jgi:hypothetical protein
MTLAGYSGQPVSVIDPAIQSHYGTGYERCRLFPAGNADATLLTGARCMK